MFHRSLSDNDLFRLVVSSIGEMGSIWLRWLEPIDIFNGKGMEGINNGYQQGKQSIDVSPYAHPEGCARTRAVDAKGLKVKQMSTNSICDVRPQRGSATRQQQQTVSSKCTHK